MKFLTLYATTEGQTRKVANFVAHHLSERGHETLCVDAEQVPKELDIHDFDGVLIAASLHLGRYQPEIVEFVRRHVDKIDRKPNAFISVSLAALSTDEDEGKGLHDCVQHFVHATGWSPGSLHHAAGAFRFTAYDFFRRWALKYIAHRHGLELDPHQDREFTDWQALGEFADTFAAEAARHALSGPSDHLPGGTAQLA